jgi:hypothetical protein
MIRSFTKMLRCIALGAVASVGLSAGNAYAQTSNYTDIWWNANESGWGISINDQTDQIFVAWYTYDTDGSQLFITMPGCTRSANGKFNRSVCEGDLYRTTGTPITQQTFVPGNTQATKIGDATLTFTGNNAATWRYTVGSTTITKSITRVAFGTGFGNYPSDASNIYYQQGADGWGFSLAQHTNNYFGVIYHYDEAGKPLYLILSGDAAVNGTINNAKLYSTRSSGSHYLSSTWRNTDITVTDIGNITFTPNANNFNLDYRYKTSSFRRPMSKLQFGSGGTGGGGGNTGTAPEVDCANWSPVTGSMDVTYSYRTNGGNTPGIANVSESIAAKVENGKWVVERTDKNTRVVTRSIYVYDNSQVGLERVEGSDGTTTTYSPIPYFPRVPQVGQTANQAYKVTITGAAGTFVSDVTVTWTYRGKDSVTVPAGTFANACKADSDISTSQTVQGFPVAVRTVGPSWGHSKFSYFLPGLKLDQTVTSVAAGVSGPAQQQVSELLDATINGVKLSN